MQSTVQRQKVKKKKKKTSSSSNVFSQSGFAALGPKSSLGTGSVSGPSISCFNLLEKSLEVVQAVEFASDVGRHYGLSAAR
jgi:hypothetical protein